MKFVIPIKKLGAVAATLAGSLLVCGQVHAGTSVGFFPTMDGGFEGQAPGLVTVLSSIATNTASTIWTVSESNSFVGIGPSISSVGGRSGPYCVTNYSCPSGQTRRLQSPTAAKGAILGSSGYVIQFYYRSSGSTVISNLQGGVSPSGTGIPNYSPTNLTVTLPGTVGTWVKFTTVETNQAGTGSGIGVVRFAGLSFTNIDVDDFVVYPGNAVDNTPPDPATSPSVPTVSGESVTLAWTDPGTGIDGGGYLVVRGTTDPTATPNVNGIYAVGDSLAPGEVVAYVGTNSSCTDTGLTLSTTYYYRIYTVDKAFNYSTAITASATTAASLTAPTTAVISPAALTVGAGSSATYTVNLTAGDPPLSYFWYQEDTSATNLLASATNATLLLTNVLGGSAGSYQVIVSNVSGMATSEVVTLTVTNDPNITLPPVSAFGLLNGTVQFTVSTAGTSPSYQWYQFDGNSLYTPYSDGMQSSGSWVSGSVGQTLTITNLQSADPTNLVVVVYNNYGSVTSSVVSLFSVDYSAPIAFWDFNGSNFLGSTTFTGTNPTPRWGVGTAFTVGSAIGFAGATDPENGAATSENGISTPQPNFSWGTDGYPATNANSLLMSNKLNGVQFNVSTLGANNITISYDARATGTASEFERVQYTTNGTTWIDYPSSTSFNGLITLFYPFSNSFVGFPGVANNPNFGFRIVPEFESTATYGNSNLVNYVGAANTYGTAGTLTYDIVTVYGDAITNDDVPMLAAIPNTNNPDYAPITIDLTVGNSVTPVDDVTISAKSLVNYIQPNFTYGGSGADRTLTITPVAGQDGVTPILVNAVNDSGQTAATWFYLTNTSPNSPPTTSLTALAATNTLENTTLVVPFTVADDHTPDGSLVYTPNSDNNTLIAATNISIGGTPSSPTLVITPTVGQIGVALISLQITDNGVTVQGTPNLDPRSTTVNISVEVRPNTNIVLVDEFDYDAAGALDTASAGFWTHLSGNAGQMQVADGVVTVDTLDNTENLQASLLGGPYKTNSGAVLYASYSVNMDPTLDPNKMPTGNGTYFTVFNDGSGVTGPYECRLIAATNGAAPGFYRLGINNIGADATTGQMFEQDLTPGVPYVVVTSLALSNGFSTLWVNPVSSYSTNVIDTTPPGANLYNIAEFELRESGTVGGSVGISNLLVGTSFSAVTGIYPPVVTNASGVTFTVGTAGSFDVGATGSPTPGLSATGALPTGVTFDPVAGVLAGTPTAGTGGTYPLTIMATNVEGTNIQNFTLTVDEAPAITSAPSASLAEGSPNSFTVTATGYPAPVFTETGALPGGVTLNPTTGVLGGTPAAAIAASYPLVITASNGVAPNATQNFTLITTNLPPVLGLDVFSTPQNTPLMSSSAQITANATDPSGVAINVAGVSASSTNGGAVVLNAGTVTYTPANGFTGRDQFGYTVNDTLGASAQGTVIVIVTTAGQAPYNTIVVNTSANPGQIQLNFTGIPGQSYVLQSAATATAPFADVPPGTPIVADANGSVQTSVTPDQTQLYYRIRTGP